MAQKVNSEAQNPLILKCNRLMEAFAKSDDERDFYLDRKEGFLIYIDLDKPEEELEALENELNDHADRYCMIPKLTFYETKKIMEGFINEKVYDIDTKEKLLDIIQSKEAREHFLEFIYDHHSELEKWQTFYQERSRIRIIEWLRNNHFHFVFEEDLDLPRALIEKIKKELFQTKASKDVLTARKALSVKAKTYYSNEALNPRPKRGRPPKQVQKAEIEPQTTLDIYTLVPTSLRAFLFTPDLHSGALSTFSSKFGNEEELFSSKRLNSAHDSNLSIESLNQKLAALRNLSSKWNEEEPQIKNSSTKKGKPQEIADEEDEDEEDFEEDEDDDFDVKPKKTKASKAKPAKTKKVAPPKKAASPKKAPKKEAAKATTSAKAAKTKPIKAPKKATSAKESPRSEKKPLRPMVKLKKQVKK